jgi:hypothetical protein
MPFNVMGIPEIDFFDEYFLHPLRSGSVLFVGSKSNLYAIETQCLPAARPMDAPLLGNKQTLFRFIEILRAE